MKNLPGRVIFKNNNVVQKKIKFRNLITLYKQDLLIKPIYQGALLDEKINEMIQSYIDNPDYFLFKNNIIVGIINNKYYIIDGQHRLEMIIELCNKYNKYDNELIITYYYLNNNIEAIKLFNEINLDSKKNKNYIEKNIFDKILINNFKSILKTNFGKYFSRKKNTGKIKSIDEFVDELININFFNYNNNNDYNKLYESLILFNNKYYDIIYKNIYDNSSYNKLLYKIELKSINNKIVFTTKQNNFIDFIYYNISEDKNELYKFKPKSVWKKEKKRITKKIRKILWFNTYDNFNDNFICPIYFCNNNINYDNFQVGHIISEYNGGTLELNNLKPICKNCNLSMGKNNWDEWEKEYTK
tara:strand:+ start:1363 stop:2433 length:1071 start_codon:yes stop_codon:yes gene_type:complete